MKHQVISQNLWDLVQGNQWIDPEDLFAAIAEEIRQPQPDFRTRLLIRDGLNALQQYWGSDSLLRRLRQSGREEQLETVWHEELGRSGFPFLRSQLVDTTKPDTIRQLFRELAGNLHKPVTLYVGGSIALILPEYLSRSTQDIDIVDEIPPDIRSLHKQLDALMQRYRLQLTHFQSHYLPSGWQNRVHSLEPFGKLHVFLVDVYDVFLSKLFSGRDKDRDDLRALIPQLDKETISRKLKDHTANLQSEAKLKKHAEDNWHILFGEALPQ
jgi:hypothetical protein